MKSIVIFVLFQIGWISCNSILSVLMPDITPTFKDAYLCYQYKLNEDKPIYITEFQTNSTKEIAHHILLYGCETPGTEEQVWNCGEMSSKSEGKEFSKGPVCHGGKQSIIYAWAMDAPKLVLPNDVAFKVGGDTSKKFLVMQVHYANIDEFKHGETDNSGINMIYQQEPVKNIAGVYLLATDGLINSHKKEHFEAACEITDDAEITPFAYRAHAHKLGLVNSGYLIKTNPVSLEQEWIELGRRSPQLPQMFYPVTNSIKINKGDILAARCTMYNFRDHSVHIGSTGADEMCNFYLMYYGRENKTLNNNICMSWGPPNWYLKNFKGLDVSKMPSDASEVPVDQLNEIPNMQHMHHGKEESTEVKSNDESKEESNEKLYQLVKESKTSSESVESDEIESYLSVLEEQYALKKLIKKYLSKN